MKSTFIYQCMKAKLLASKDHEDFLFLHRDDPACYQEIIASHGRLVISIVMGYRPAQSLVNDLIQEGFLGLLRAIERYESDQGVRFASYARFWIQCYVRQFMAKNSMKVEEIKDESRLFLGYTEELERDYLKEDLWDKRKLWLRHALRSLTHFEYFVISSIFLHEIADSSHDLAQKYNLPMAKVRQAEHRALRKLRTVLLTQTVDIRVNPRIHELSTMADGK